MKEKSLSHVWLFATPWTVAYNAPPSMRFSRQEYWSGVPLPSPVTNLDSILKSRDITLPTKVHLVKAVVFPVVIESWTIKKAERWRTDAFQLGCWRRLLRVPWTARRSDPSILKKISPEYSLEWLMQKLKLQYFGHLMWRANSLEKTLMLGKIEGGRSKGRQRMRWLDGITDSMDMSLSDLRGGLACCSPRGHKVSDTTEQLNWTVWPHLYLSANVYSSAFFFFKLNCLFIIESLSFFR